MLTTKLLCGRWKLATWPCSQFTFSLLFWALVYMCTWVTRRVNRLQGAIMGHVANCPIPDHFGHSATYVYENSVSCGRNSATWEYLALCSQLPNPRPFWALVYMCRRVPKIGEKRRIGYMSPFYCFIQWDQVHQSCPWQNDSPNLLFINTTTLILPSFSRHI